MNIKRIIFDADDTLWENNVYYVQAAEDFFNMLEACGYPRSRAEHDFDILELEVVNERGYGSHNFVYIMEELKRRYTEIGLKIDENEFNRIIDRFKAHPVQKPRLFKEVIETLQYLRSKYEIYILTKGEYEEQKGKIVRAGVDKIANHYFIPPEKDDSTYLGLLREHGWNANECCMVGNSPKSDINPALRSGMYAVHIPYKDTWKLDNEPLENANGRLIVLKKFSDLKRLF